MLRHARRLLSNQAVKRYFEFNAAPSIPANSPSYFKGPFIFYRREYFIIAFRSTAAAIEAALPHPIKPVGDDIVLYEFMNMPDSPGLGSYSESGILIPGKFHGKDVNFTAQMYLDCEPAIYAGREIWGFPKTRGNPSLKANEDTLVGRLLMGGEEVALGTMPYKAEAVLPKHHHTKEAYDHVYKKLTKPQMNLKIIPKVDGSDAERQLIEYTAQVIAIHEAWKGPARLNLVPHSLAPVADFPVREVLGATHIIADIILPYGSIVHDYLKTGTSPSDARDGKVLNTFAQNSPSIPMNAPSYSRSLEHVFYNREHFVITVRTTKEAMRNALPEPLEPTEDCLVHFSFMTMKDSPGFGSYTETSVRVNCTLKGQRMSYVQQVYSDSSSSQYGGREMWGLPMKRGMTDVVAQEDTLVGTLSYGGARVAYASMPYKAQAILPKHERSVEVEREVIEMISQPRVSLKIVPNVDGQSETRQLVSYRPKIDKIHEAWKGPARLHLVPHVNAPLSDFPILETIGAVHITCDMSLPLGEILHDYNA